MGDSSYVASLFVCIPRGKLHGKRIFCNAYRARLETFPITESGNSTNYKVVEITANSLKLSTEMVLSGTNTTIDFSFAGQ